MKTVRIGELLVDSGFITEKQLEAALEKQKNKIENPTGLKLGDFILKMGYVSETQLIHALSTNLKVPFVDLSTTKIDVEAVRKIPEAVARKHICLGYKIANGRIYVATNDPINFHIFEELKVMTGMEVHPMLATKSSILATIGRAYSQSAVSSVVDDLNKEYDANRQIREAAEVEASEERVDNAPVVKLVNSLVDTAFQRKASDIHIEPYKDRTRVRIRIDGELVELMQVKPTVHPAIVTRLKILGEMNIAEKRIPLDGRFNMAVSGNTVDVRVSTLPTVYGEKVVIRLLASNNDTARHVTELGMTDYNYEMFRDIIRSPHGVMLVTGPTGSGKSTTLYSTLNELSRVNVNIVTVEDPVEIRMDGINQVQVNQRAGLDFATSLRSILRQDPDIIMIGEIRDGETADIAIRAAITGHLVLSTLHTNDAASTIMRLIDMGVAPYMVASSLIGIIAQRLIKLLCPSCKDRVSITDPVDLKLLGRTTPIVACGHHAGGCKDCNHTGFKGRTAIHEIIVTSNDIKEIISNGGTAADIEEKAIKNGTRLLRHNVAQMVIDGKTTMSELIRATYSV